MPLPSVLDQTTVSASPPAGRLMRWWTSQAPHIQDRMAVLAPLFAVVIFLAAIVSAFGYLRLEEITREREGLNRDVEYTQQRLRLRLLEQQEQLMRFAREVSSREITHADFVTRAENFSNQFPELNRLTWIR